MQILAIDPGELVGWCRAEVVGNFVITDYKDGITPAKLFVETLHETAGDYDLIVYETWRLFGSKSRALIGNEMLTSQCIGGIKLCAWVHGVPIIGQGPDIKKTADKICPEEWKHVIDGESSVHDEAHHVDAFRHLIYYLWRQKHNV